MSDSDDTDILLLIPPNFFLTETNLNESPNYEMFRSNLEEQRPLKSAIRLSPGHLDKSSSSLTNRNQSQCVHLSHSKDYSTTTPSCQLKYRPFNEPSPSSVNVSQLQRSFERLNCISSNDVINAMYDESEKLAAHRRSSSPLRRLGNTGHELMGERAASLGSQKMSDWRTGSEATRNQDHLISLTNVWNNKNQDLKSTLNHSTELEEERLRRRQCERNIALLQSQLNQCQNKFTDVIKMDQAKNDTLTKLHNTNSR